MLKSGLKIVLGAVLAGAASGAAMAQSTGGNYDSCSSYVYDQSSTFSKGSGPGYATFNKCIGSDLSRMRTIYVPTALQRGLAASFGFGPTAVEPAGLSDVIADDRLQDSEIQIAPAAAEAAAVKWNAWGDGRYLYSDYSAAVGNLDGPTWSGIAGLDYKLNDKTTFGILVSLDSTRLDSAVNDSNSWSIGAGPYLGIVLNDNIVFSANLMGSAVETEQAGGALQFKTGRIQASTGLTGYYYKDTWRFTPGITASWSRDWEVETSNFALPDRVIDVGVLTPSLQVGNTLRLSDTTTVEPWAGVAFDWTFLNHVDVSGGGSSDDATADLRAQLGLNFSFNNNAQLAITAEASGFLLDDLNAYSISANFAAQF